MKQFIDLDRSFLPIPTNQEFKEEDYDSSLLLGVSSHALSGTKKWADLLQLWRVIILAEAGAGKTAEVRASTERLRAEGKRAFFLRLEQLYSQFKTSFDIGDDAEFRAWLSSDEPGWFFLDSVDEARLYVPKHFETAIRNFAIELGDGKYRAHIYITSRPSEWRPGSDLSLVRQQMPCELVQAIPKQGDDDSGAPSGSIIDGNIAIVAPEKKLIEPEVFSLLPLDQGQIKTFSRAFGIHDWDSFVEALHKAEADIFARRPGDLIDLLEYWQKCGTIAKRAELIESRISSQLAEREPDHAGAFPLSIREARYGAEMLAAAVTFQRKRRILVPESNPDPMIREGSVNAQEVLTDWSCDQVRALLQRPIFDEAIYGAVRFHHRIVCEYLTAQWLYGLLSKGKARHAIEHLFFTECYGCEVSMPSMRPILSWLILRDDRIQGKAAKIVPEVFIEGGDPSVLPTDVRKDLLTQFCFRHADQSVKDTWFEFSELRRFAHPDLSEAINHLLELYSGHEVLRALLLEIVWQGEIRGCSEKAVEFALNTTNDEYTRTYAIRAVGAIGSDIQKRAVVDGLLADRALTSERLIAEIVREFAPDTLSIDETVTLIARTEHPEEHSPSSLRRTLQEFSQDKCPQGDILKWIDGISLLLKTPPVVERCFFEVSERYNWLLPVAAMAAERLVRIRHRSALDRSVLEVISRAQAGRAFGDHDSEESALDDLVPQWPELNRALFWFDVELARRELAKKGERVTTWWRASVHPSYWQFPEADFRRYLEDIAARPHMDDRLVALSVAFHVYRENGRGRTRLSAMKKAVRGVPELEDALSRFLKRPAMSDQERRLKRRNRYHTARRKEHETRQVANRIKSCEWLRSHAEVLRDTSLAPSGRVSEAIYYVLRELRRDQENSDKWVNANWESLIPEFGREVGEGFRDGCMDYWRKYRPEVKSDGVQSQNGTPAAVLVGLAGLAMEARHIPGWSHNLSKEEAKIACRYAINELNGFPGWFADLHAAFPDVVMDTILAEIEWEFCRYSGDIACSYVLDKVAWYADWLKPDVSRGIVSVLKAHEPKHDDTVRKALGIVLGNSSIDKVALIEIAKAKLPRMPSTDRRALWLAAWMCIDAPGALQTLQVSLDESADAEHATDLSMQFVVALLGERWAHVPSVHQDFMQTEILASLTKLMHMHIRIGEDIDRSDTGAYSPGLRDNAQDARNRLSQLLRDIPGKPAYLALMGLAEHHPNEHLRQWFGLHAKRRAEADAEAEPWQAGDVACFAKEAERAPQNHRELFDLAVLRLTDLKLDLEEGDTSLAGLLIKATEETEYRNAIGDWLRNHSHSRYSVPQEEELADAKRPDIRIHGMGIDGPVSIELKVADNWAGPELLERLSNQLCGQYLRDPRSNCGVFLLVYRGTRSHWEHPATGRHLCFGELVQFLDEEAKKIVAQDEKVDDLKVLGIDLLKRSNSTRRKA